jgi:L-aspartate oxidase
MIRTLQIHQSILKRSFATGSHATSVCGGVACEWNSRFRSSRRFSTTAAEDRLLVVGSGVAGSAAALIAAETYRIPVTLLFAGNVPEDCNSSWAQGGIIYRNYDPESGDSADSLAQDIHRAGAGLCEDPAVRKVAEEGPDRVRQLLLNGGPYADVPFDKRPDGELSLCLGK